MAAIDFPASPSVNQTHTASGITWTWDGTSWKAQGSTTTYTLPTASTGTLGGVKVGGNFTIDGAGTLSLSAAAISGLSDVTAASADYLMLWDATDSSLKKVDAGELLGGGGGGGLSSIGIQSGGTQVGSGITQLNFIGTGNTFAVSGNTVDVSISGGGDTVDAIIPVAYAFVNADTAGTGTGMSWGAYNSSNGRMEFTFGTALSDANYYVLAEREQYDTHTVSITNKTTTGFRATWYGNDGTSPLAPSTFGGVLIVYASNPLTSVGSLNTNDGVVVKHDGSTVGTAGTINFSTNLDVSAISAGIVTVTASGGGGSQNLFQNIAVSGQSNIVADSTTDTLTVAAGSNVTITTNAGTDTLTVAAANDNTQLSTEEVQDIVGAMFSGNTETNITATYEDSDGTIDLVASAGGISNVIDDTTPQLGGNLDLNTKTINGTGTINITGTIIADGADIDDFLDVGSNIQLGNAGVITATSYQGSGAALTDLNATKLTSGTVPTARLGSGTAGNTVFLRGDNTWATPSGGGSGISNVIDDATPQLGGNLDLNTKTINGTGTINITGDVTATNFYGNGANLTNLPGTGYFVENSTGIHTTSNVGIGTTTASSTLTVGGSIETTTGGIQIGPNNTTNRSGSLGFGGAGSLSYTDNHGSSGNVATVTLKNSYGAANSDVIIQQRGDFKVENLADKTIFKVQTSWTNSLVNTGNVRLYYKSSSSASSSLERLKTSNIGVEIPTGSLKIDEGEIQVGSTFKAGQAGVVTATSYDGSGADLTNLNGTNIASGTIAAARVATLNQDTTGSSGSCTGNAATATKLASAVNIGGVSFDGSAAINLPGVNAAGTQDTSGNAATATALATARNIGGVSFDGSAAINLPGVNAAGTQDTSGNAATATALSTSRTIAGVSFDGTANISLNNNAITNGASYVTSSIINSLNASNLDSGTVPTARLGSGTASNSTYLRGDNTWASVPASGIGNVVEDTTPQLGGNLDLNSKTINGTGTINITGTATATSFDGELAYHTAWTLGASGSSHYTFTGNGLDGAENDPTIYVIRGQKYAFKNRSGGHPFRIQTSFQNTSGTAYNDGVTNNSAGNGTDLIWNVQFDAPDVLYYQCTAHTNMSGKIIVLGSNVTAVTWTASAGSAHTIDTVPWNSFLSAEYTIHISHSTGIQSEKLLVMCDGTSGSDHHTEYTVMYSGSVLGTFSTTTSGSDVLVRFNPANAGSTTIKFIKSIVQ